MSLQVWLPLDGNLENKGLQNIILTNNGATVSNDGKIGKCYSFSSSSISGTLSIPKDSWSVAAWICPSSTTAATNQYAVCMNNSDASNFLFSLGLYDNKLAARIGNTSYPSTIVYALNTWYHLCITYDGNVLKIYVDGILNTTVANPVASSQTTRFTIGRRYGDAGIFSGRLNDIRVYDHVLSAAEVKEISKGLICHYKLDGFRAGARENILTNSTGYFGTTDWSGQVTAGTNEDTPYLISKRVDTTSTSRTFCTHASITSLVSSWTPGTTKFTLSGYYKIPSSETYEVTGNMFIRWKYTTSAATYADTGWSTPSSPVKDTWVYFEKTYTVPASYQNGSATFYLSAFSQGLSTIYWKHVKLELGDKATAWTPTDSEINFDKTIIHDSSGYGHHGTSMNAPGLNTNSIKYNISMSFNGTNQYICCYRGCMVKDEISVCVWAYMNNWSNYNRRIISCTEGGGWNFEPNSGKMNFACGTGASGNTYKSITSATTLESLGAGWHFFVGTYDGFKTKIYIDGVLEGTNDAYSTKTPLYYHSSNGMFIGAEAASSQTSPAGSYFEGYISDVHIYATALSAENILALYQTEASITNGNNVHTEEILETGSSSIGNNGIVNSNLFIENNNVSLSSNYITANEFIEV